MAGGITVAAGSGLNDSIGAGKGRRVRAQEKFYREAVAAVRDAAHAAPQFRPLTRPKPEE